MNKYNYLDCYATLINNTSDGIVVLEEGFVVECNPASLKMLKLQSKEQMLHNSLYVFFPEMQNDGKNSIESIDEKYKLASKHGNNRFVWEFKSANNSRFQVDILMTAIVVNETTLFGLTMKDISEDSKRIKRMEYYAYYDVLTKLPNRRLFINNLENLIGENIKSKQYGALLFINIDNFKNINSMLGHMVGDRLLIEVARTIRASLSLNHSAYRFGADEYVVLLTGLGTDFSDIKEAVTSIAKCVLKKLSSGFEINEQTLSINFNIGISILQPKYIKTDDVIEQASFALLGSKRLGKKIAFYNESDHLKAMKQKEIQTGLKKAIESEQISVVFQTQVNNKKVVVGVEALLRWQHEKYGNLEPEYVIEQAGIAGLLNQLGNYMLSKSIRQIVNINKLYNKRLKLSVNISPCQFQAIGFTELIQNYKTKYNLDDGFLTLEITEDVVINNFETIFKKMNVIRGLGVNIALDDFGTGFSSLSYLKKLPLDQLKIDKSFVFDMLEDVNNKELIKQIIKISKIYNLTVIAEGVETIEQFNYLTHIECDLFQGFLFEKPLGQNKLVNLLLR